MIQSMPEGVDSKFRLVLLIARRAEQLMRGARPKLETDRPLKPTRLAAAEFEENQVRWGYGAEGGVLEAPGEETEAAEEELVGGRDRRLIPRPARDSMNRPPRVLLGVSGGIAAYKAVEVLRELTARGADVRVAMTRGAREFVAPLTFAVLSRHEVYTEVWGSGNAPPSSTWSWPTGATCSWWRRRRRTPSASSPTASPTTSSSTCFLAHRGPVLLAPAMESGDVGKPGRAGERGACCDRAGRRSSVPRAGRSRRATGRGPDVRARRDRRRSLAAGRRRAAKTSRG